MHNFKDHPERLNTEKDPEIGEMLQKSGLPGTATAKPEPVQEAPMGVQVWQSGKLLGYLNTQTKEITNLKGKLLTEEQKADALDLTTEARKSVGVETSKATPKVAKNASGAAQTPKIKKPRAPMTAEQKAKMLETLARARAARKGK